MYIRQPYKPEKAKKEISIWAMIALLGGLLLLGVITYSTYQVSHKTLCSDIYMQGQPGVYCQ